MSGLLDGITAGELPPGRYRLGFRTTVRDLRDDFAAAGWTMRIVDGAAMPDRAALFGEFATACDMPEWFGANWDALVDALRDLSWLPPRPIVLLWQRSALVGPVLREKAGEVIDAAIADRVAADLPPLYLLYPPGPGAGDNSVTAM